MVPVIALHGSLQNDGLGTHRFKLSPLLLHTDFLHFQLSTFSLHPLHNLGREADAGEKTIKATIGDLEMMYTSRWLKYQQLRRSIPEVLFRSMAESRSNSTEYGGCEDRAVGEKNERTAPMVVSNGLTQSDTYFNQESVAAPFLELWRRKAKRQSLRQVVWISH